jgi:hypothetical protein
VRTLPFAWLVALLGLAGGTADAEPAWRIDAPCASRGELAGRLRADGAIAVRLELVATELGDGRWRAVVVVAGGPERRVEGGSCREVVEAAVVVALLALDGAALAGQIAGAAVGIDAIEPPRPTPRSRSVGVVAATSRARPATLRPLVRAAVVLERGILPGATAGEEVMLGLARGEVSVLLGGVVLHDRTAIVHGQTIVLDAWAARALGCLGAGGLSGCLGGELGQLGVVAPASSRSGAGRLYAVAGELAAGAQMTRHIRGFATLSAALGLARPRVELDDRELVHQIDRLSVRLGLGLEVAIP